MSASGDELDVLVLGAGLAGVAAALEALEQGARVGIVSAGRASSHRAQGGIAAAIGPGDSPELHAEDTMAAGRQAGDRRVVAGITASAPGAYKWLESYGVAFDRDGSGLLLLGLEGGHSRPRILHSDGDRSGRAFMAALEPALRARSRLTRYANARLVDLLVDGDGVAGAVLRTGGRLVPVAARSTVLATGGFAGLYPRTTNSRLSDGHGIVAAIRAGALVSDLHLVQRHPTVFAGAGTPFLVTEALRGAGATITDARGRRFLSELAPRDVVSAAIDEQLVRSGAAHAFLDARSIGRTGLAERFGGFVERCLARGIDPAVAPVPIAPAAHYTMGGVVTDTCGRTSVPGLWAAGECAWIGLHGRNRLASNSLLEAVVMGRRAGCDAARSGRARARPPAPVTAPAPGRVTRRMVIAALLSLTRPEAANDWSPVLEGRGMTPEVESARELAAAALTGRGSF